MTAGQFIEALWAEKPADQMILLWTWPDRRSYWCKDMAEATLLAESLQQTLDVYIGVGLRGKDLGPTRRGTNDEVTGITGMWADIDLKSLAHQKEKLPPTATEGLEILPPGAPPSIVIHTGNGLHVWWLFKEPWVFETPEERARAEAMAARWQTMLSQNAAIRGWGFDRLGDVARVLRIPGTQNHKDPAKPKNVVVTQWHPEIRYEPGDIEEILDSFGIPDAEAAKRASVEWAARFHDVPLRIEPKAEYSLDMIQQFCEIDMRFKNTWLRQRHDLKDQSQSGYDMAIAMFCVEAGMNEQALVDMIVTHRRIHNQKQRLNPDYYQRTISKAFEHTAVPAPPLPEIPGIPSAQREEDPVCQSPAPGAPPSGPSAEPAPAPPRPDPLRMKAILWQTLSEVFGIHIVRISKISGKDPIYLIDLENATVELSHVRMIRQQALLSDAIAAQTEKIINPIKSKEWRAVSQKILDSLIVKEGGEETSMKGSTRLYLDSYLSETEFIPSIESQTHQTRRKPAVLDTHPGQISICASDFLAYLGKMHNQKLTPIAVTAMLSSIGSLCVTVRGKGRDQSRWVLPADDFSPAQYRMHIQEDEKEQTA